jgi:AcrR family transcriptional regulator
MTLRTYARTVSELFDRRARKKARTREQIRAIAHRRFDEHGFDAVTIADVARQADVAVQTVFNHFTTKEELFFDGRVPWVDGPAEAVRSRGASVPPLTALRGYLVELAGSLVSSMAIEERRRYVATLEASETLRTHERELIFEAERRLSSALYEAWTDPAATDGHPAAADPDTAAPLTAAIWLSALRVLVIGQRAQRLSSGTCPTELAPAVGNLVAELLAQLEASAPLIEEPARQTRPAVAGPSDTGWPHGARRAG